MTKAEILIIVIAALAALIVIGPSDYEHALVQDAMRKDMPRPSPVFEGKHEARVMTHPLSQPKDCDMTLNGRCYIRSSK